jgi:hypothetical protein
MQIRPIRTNSQRIDGVVFGMRADKLDEHYLPPEVE